MQSGNTVPILPYPAFAINRYAAMATEVTQNAAVKPEETIKPAPQAGTESEKVTTAPPKETEEPRKNDISFESFRATNDNVTFSNYTAGTKDSSEPEDTLQTSLLNLDAKTEPTIDIMM